MEAWQILVAVWLVGIAFFVWQFVKADELDSNRTAVTVWGINGAAIAIFIAAAIWPVMLPWAIWKELHG